MFNFGYFVIVTNSTKSALMKSLFKLLRKTNPFLVVFVCTANRGRSPYAVSRLKYMLYEYEQKIGHYRDPLPIRALGAGVHTTYGEGPLPEIVKLAWERGLDIRNHVAAPFDVELEKKSNVILTMEKRHSKTLLRRFPLVEGRLFCLTDYLKDDISGGGDIPDPTDGDYKDIIEIIDIIDAELIRIFPGILKAAGIE